MKFFRVTSFQAFLACLLAAASAMWPVAASAQVSANNYNFYPSGSAMWVVSPAGRVSYCLVAQNASGGPLSKCNVIAALVQPRHGQPW